MAPPLSIAHACAIDKGGAIECWGYEDYGEVSDSPIILPALNDTLALGLEAGVAVECNATASDGSDSASSSVAVQVNTPPSLSSVALSYSGTLSVNDASLTESVPE